jgi:hypothetical protein
MYNVVLTKDGKVEFNYAFSSKVKAEEFFKITLLEHDSHASIRTALTAGVYSNISVDDPHPEVVIAGRIRELDLKSWVLSISKAQKGSAL